MLSSKSCQWQHLEHNNKKHVSCDVFQGEGFWPASRPLLRGVPVRPPPGRDLCAGGRLEGREWGGRGTDLCVGAEDGSEAVGDAQQVRAEGGCLI